MSKKKFIGEDGKEYIAKVKKPFYKKWWFIVLMVIIVGSLFVNKGGNNSGSNTGDSGTSESQSAAEDNKPIEYTPVSARELITTLSENALNAEKTYNDQYLEISGKISVIDSDGKYITIDGDSGEITLANITCKIKDDAQIDVIAGLKIGQSVIVKGKVTDIGEVLGYKIDMDEIIPN